MSETRKTVLPANSAERKAIPLACGVLDYFPAALAAVAEVSRAGNDKHNPGAPLHHSRGKSADHADCIMRHLMDRGAIDPEDGQPHSAKLAWRALALLQEELEAAGAPLARGAWLPKSEPDDASIVLIRVEGGAIPAVSAEPPEWWDAAGGDIRGDFLHELRKGPDGRWACVHGVTTKIVPPPRQADPTPPAGTGG